MCEVDLNLIHYRLPGLDIDTWQTYFKYRGLDPTSAIFPLHQTYGGNAKAMEIIAGNIHADFEGDLAMYLRSSRDLYDLETGLKQLIINQFDRLQLRLHPAIRAECISRLRHTDLIEAHQQAAEY